jgi:pilus assembly protein Flp/PilA
MILSRLRAQSKIKRLIADEAGTVALDYGMIASLLAVALITGLTPLGSNLGSSFKAAAEAVLSARAPTPPPPAATPATGAPDMVAPTPEVAE